MNLLLDELPETIRIGNADYEVNSDFRVFVQMELLFQEHGIRPKDKILLALQYFYVELPDDFTSAVEKLLWFYRCGEPLPDSSAPIRPKKETAAYSFEQDSGSLFAAFYERYHIDLSSVRLHWWKFRALMNPLLSGISFPDIVQFRCADTRKLPKERALYFNQMKKLFSLNSPSLEHQVSSELHQQKMKDYVAKRLQQANQNPNS